MPSEVLAFRRGAGTLEVEGLEGAVVGDVERVGERRAGETGQDAVLGLGAQRLREEADLLGVAALGGRDLDLLLVGDGVEQAGAAVEHGVRDPELLGQRLGADGLERRQVEELGDVGALTTVANWADGVPGARLAASVSNVTPNASKVAMTDMRSVLPFVSPRPRRRGRSAWRRRVEQVGGGAGVGHVIVLPGV